MIYDRLEDDKDLSNKTEINKPVSTLHYRLNELNKISQYTDFKTRLAFVNSHVIGKLTYRLPLYMHCTAQNIDKLHKVLMKSARLCIGSYCFKKQQLLTFEVNVNGIVLML